MAKLIGAGISGNVIRQPLVSVEIITKPVETGVTVLNAPIIPPPTPPPPGAWDLVNATYSTNSFNVGGQEGGTIGVFISSDGTKVYVTGFITDNVIEYDLGTAHDISTAVYNGNFLNSSPQDGTMTSVTFSPDGLSLFTTGDAGNSVYKYNLTVAWDITTATYGGFSFSVVTQTSAPQCVVFSTLGTKMYVVGNNIVYQYTLTTGFDLTTATYDSVNFSLSGENGNATSLFFKTDGSRMFSGDATNSPGYIVQYDLGIDYDISSSVYNSVRINTSPQGGFGASGMAWSLQGDRVYKVSNGNNIIYQYDVSI